MNKNLFCRQIVFIFFLSTLFLHPCFAKSLPGLPTHLALPFRQATELQQKSAFELQQLFTENEYNLATVHTSQQIPSIFVANLPPDISALPVPQKTALFIRLLLTSVAKVNQNILAVRTETQRLSDKTKGGKKLSAEETTWLAGIAADYYCAVDKFDDLLQRIDILPISLVLAQAIDESGWGTSHFAREGNALYGQHLGKDSKGSFLSTPDGQVKVASFDNLYHSTASYIHNINTTKTYAALREERTESRQKNNLLNGNEFAGALSQYSTRGQLYVKTLRSIIRHYELELLDSVQFSRDDSQILVIFKK